MPASVGAGPRARAGRGRDFDNPFGYYERYSGADVSLKPLEDAVLRLAQTAGVEGSGTP